MADTAQQLEALERLREAIGIFREELGSSMAKFVVTVQGLREEGLPPIFADNYSQNYCEVNCNHLRNCIERIESIDLPFVTKNIIGTQHKLELERMMS